MKYILMFAAMMCLAITLHAQEKITPAAPGITYGKTITATNAIATSNLDKALGTDSVYHGKVEGNVVEVCTKKGCFMKLAQPGKDPIMVRFTDYAYFMPQNIVGKTVVVEGTAKVTETSIERLKHYAADAGKSKEEIAAINQPKKAVSIMADGVIVVK